MAVAGCKSGCGEAKVKALTHTQAVSHLGQSIAAWSKAGFQMVDAKTHDQRYKICTECPGKHFRMFQCSLCHCIAICKTKLKTETCPAGYWT